MTRKVIRMKIAITGEGKTDFGQKEYSTGKWLPGPAIVYAENIAKEKGAEVKFRPFNVIFMENEVTSYIFE